MLEHNKIVYDEVIERLKTSSRVCIVQATGTGKGVIASSLIEDYVKVLVVAPTNAILENYRMNLGVNSENIIFYTYQGISMLLNNQIEELGEKVSLIILDEFHRIGAETWGRKVEMLCDIAEAKGCKTVGLSATPVRYLDNERDMSEEFFKGNVVNGLNIVDAVVSGVLPTFKYVVSYYGYEKDLFKRIEESKKQLSADIKKLLSNIENNYNIGKIIRQEVKGIGKNQKWVVFFNTVEELNSFEKEVPLWFDVDVNVLKVHSGRHSSENMRVLKEFNNIKKGINVLLSVNMLNEGVHIKDIDGVIMLRRTISPIVYLQQLGRALQIGGKNPIIFDFIGNYRRLDKYSEWCFNVIEDINNKFEEIDKIQSNERKIIVSSYCEEMFEIIESIQNALYDSKIHIWTEEEDNIIKEYYSKGGSRLCHKKGLDYIPMYKIGNHARRLGLNYSVSWTEEEDRILREYFPKYGSNMCIEKGLTYKNKDSICIRAKQLGVKFDCSIWTKEEDNILKTYYPIGGSKLCREKGLKSKSSQQISTRAGHLHLNWNGKMPNYTDIEDEIIRKYYPIGGSKLCIEKGVNRTASAIHSRAIYINVESSNKKTKWSEEEDNIVKTYYPIGGSKLCQEKGLKNRTVSMISNRATLYNLKFQPYWENWEIELLKTYYPIGGSKLCQEKGLTNRPIHVIGNQANRLGLKLETYLGLWTDEEIGILKENYLDLGENIVELLPNRTWLAIQAKAVQIGIKRSRGWSEEELKILKENFIKLGKNIIELLPNRSWDTIRKKARVIGLKRK